MNYNLITLQEGLRLKGILITRESLDKFNIYMDLLLYWNERVNLTAIKDPEEVIVKHFLDSLSLLWDEEIENLSSMIDIGTGAGFPGVPIKILRPDMDLVLLDSTRKRTDFLKLLIKELELEKVEIIHSRAEFVGRDPEYREKFGIAVSRAVAPLRLLAELCLPFIEPGGCFVSYKGPAAQDEILEAQKAIEVLGGSYPPKTKRVHIPYSQSEHNLIYIQKSFKTKDIYPRTPKKIKKSPL